MQRAYRKLKFRRLIKRALMDTAWTTFIEKQKALAVQNDLTLKRQAAKLYALEKREGVLTPEQIKAAA